MDPVLAALLIKAGIVVVPAFVGWLGKHVVSYFAAHSKSANQVRLTSAATNIIENIVSAIAQTADTQRLPNGTLPADVAASLKSTAIAQATKQLESAGLMDALKPYVGDVTSWIPTAIEAAVRLDKMRVGATPNQAQAQTRAGL